jgi:dihydrofolate reductase
MTFGHAFIATSLDNYIARRNGRHAYIDGGKIIQSFLREGLITDLVVTRVPIPLGDGISLFGSLMRDIQLKHITTTAFPSGFVQSKYEILKEINEVTVGDRAHVTS